MPFNTITVGSAVTPTVIETCFSHYLNRKPLRQKPTAHVSYHEGLELIRQFLLYASHHTVEEIQAFTSQWVPSPRWVKVQEAKVPEETLSKAAEILQNQLGHHGILRVGGKTWWQWRRHGTELEAEWIEMRSDYQERKKTGNKGNRIMLYVHGGAYFFGSVDEHRYQMQRHARKLKARVFARILVTLRDQGIPLPAGAILISPWVDLTHSFPSVAGDNSLDYIPNCGFLHRPSPAWPPPNTDDMLEIAMTAVGQVAQKLGDSNDQDAVQGFSVTENPDIPRSEQHGGSAAAGTDNPTGVGGNTAPGPGHDLSIMLDGNLVEIKDQIQMYANNQLISHPLVSPVLQPSLGGLPPLLIMTGGGEVLRDEQIYLAHKAANPSKYPPGDAYLDNDHGKDDVSKWKGTDVQLQVWDDCCHVAPTLSFTRPAKYMYRSIAQFGAWALARAQKTEIEIMDDDDVSVISEDSEDGTSERTADGDIKRTQQVGELAGTQQVGKAGDALPPFRNHMIRERVDRHGNIFPLAPASVLPALQLRPSEIGVIKAGPIQKWMAAKKKWDTKYAREKRRVQKQRAKEMAAGFEGFGDDEVPPPSALAGRRRADMPKEAKKGRSWGMSLWSVWGSSHDEKTLEREGKANKVPENTALKAELGSTEARHDSPNRPSRSRRRTVTDAGQTSAAGNGASDEADETTSAADILSKKDEDPNRLGPTAAATTFARSESATGGVKPTHLRPNVGPVAYPFKLAPKDGQEVNASTMTLNSARGVLAPVDEGGNGSAEAADAEHDKVAVRESEGVSAARPEPHSFVTASEGLGI